ncbi:hypothetical protein M9H77_20993 [Catharanthus roseus]|uniref:Uncharacterized protein n=1 Tax=Catharanthus roseus TaxID=4058 RepID=A0ACC0AN39_CATRO|nr:hypothetical protein M9H77_20993 [Catharanthus roseus]
MEITYLSQVKPWLSSSLVRLKRIRSQKEGKLVSHRRKERKLRRNRCLHHLQAPPRVSPTLTIELEVFKLSVISILLCCREAFEESEFLALEGCQKEFIEKMMLWAVTMSLNGTEAATELNLLTQMDHSDPYRIEMTNALLEKL